MNTYCARQNLKMILWFVLPHWNLVTTVLGFSPKRIGCRPVPYCAWMPACLITFAHLAVSDFI
jgi:hypothetical protein